MSLWWNVIWKGNRIIDVGEVTRAGDAVMHPGLVASVKKTWPKCHEVSNGLYHEDIVEAASMDEARGVARGRHPEGPRS